MMSQMLREDRNKKQDIQMEKNLGVKQFSGVQGQLRKSEMEARLQDVQVQVQW